MEIVTGNISFVQDNKIPNKSKSQNLFSKSGGSGSGNALMAMALASAKRCDSLR